MNLRHCLRAPKPLKMSWPTQKPVTACPVRRWATCQSLPERDAFTMTLSPGRRMEVVSCPVNLAEAHGEAPCAVSDSWEVEAADGGPPGSAVEMPIAPRRGEEADWGWLPLAGMPIRKPLPTMKHVSRTAIRWRGPLW